MKSIGFTRQETLSITGTTSGKLSYLDETGLIRPKKIGNPKHPKVVYSWEQLFQIKIIDRLRSKLSLQDIGRLLEIVKAKDYRPDLFGRDLVFIGLELYLIEDWENFGLKVLKVAGKNKGRVSIRQVGAIGDIFSELRIEAEKHSVLDFDKRAS